MLSKLLCIRHVNNIRLIIIIIITVQTSRITLKAVKVTRKLVAVLLKVKTMAKIKGCAIFVNRRIIKEQREDPNLKKHFDMVKNGNKMFFIRDGILYHRNNTAIIGYSIK
jgi:hypothetical protein